ncbi:hypothetical protein BC834DRAFT_421814 [Gloeopeniophorella convolvens]|nr:hypothetical protein BC834DRAFT_421814 [Gloeopeniophorella convolvens]
MPYKRNRVVTEISGIPQSIGVQCWVETSIESLLDVSNNTKWVFQSSGLDKGGYLFLKPHISVIFQRLSYQCHGEFEVSIAFYRRGSPAWRCNLPPTRRGCDPCFLSLYIRCTTSETATSFLFPSPTTLPVDYGAGVATICIAPVEKNSASLQPICPLLMCWPHSPQATRLCVCGELSGSLREFQIPLNPSTWAFLRRARTPGSTVGSFRVAVAR